MRISWHLLSSLETKRIELSILFPLLSIKAMGNLVPPPPLMEGEGEEEADEGEGEGEEGEGGRKKTYKRNPKTGVSVLPIHTCFTLFMYTCIK